MKKFFSRQIISWYLISFCYAILTYLGASKMALAHDNIEFFKTTNLLNYSTLIGLTQFLLAFGLLFKSLEKYVIISTTLFLVFEIVLRISSFESQGILVPFVMIILTWIAVISRKHFTK